MIVQEKIKVSEGHTGRSSMWFAPGKLSPPSPIVGDAYFNTITGLQMFYNGYKWIPLQ